MNIKKIDQYEKFLNHYQLNASVDMGEQWAGGSMLDRSICQEIEGLEVKGGEGEDRKSADRLQKTPGRQNNNNLVSIART